MLRASLLIVLGLATLGAVYSVMAAAPQPSPSASTTASTATDARPAPVASPPEPRLVLRKVRDVTPAGITSGPAVTGPLVRLAPPAPPPEPRPEARGERVHKLIVVAAGVIKAGGRDIRLAGIEAPEFKAECGEGAAAWPCGRMARAALRRFIRGRAVECVVPPGSAEIPDIAECSLAGESLSAWLVAQGWAQPTSAAHAGLAAAAREMRLGLWSDGRPGGQPGALAAAPASSPDSASTIRPRVSGTP
jgi:endonuclease YncB( thermonuclease family)